MSKKRTVTNVAITIVAGILVSAGIIWGLTSCVDDKKVAETTITKTTIAMITETTPDPTAQEPTASGTVTETTIPETTPVETSAETTVPTTTATVPATVKPTTGTTTPKATATPKPTATPVPTTAPTTTTAATTAPADTLTASEVKSIVWSVVESVRSANGLTTNRSDVLSTRCRKSAERYVVSHSIPNGSSESCGAIFEKGDGTWCFTKHSGAVVIYNTINEAASAYANELIVNHAPEMATDSTYTEFGVGVALRDEEGCLKEYYVYISCSTPEGLQYQIDNGWYD